MHVDMGLDFGFLFGVIPQNIFFVVKYAHLE